MLKKKLKPAVKRVLLGVLALLIAICSILGYIGYKEYSYRFSTAVEKSGDVKIYPDMNFEQVTSMLENEGYIKSAQKMTKTAIRYEREGAKVGNYRLTKGESYRTLLNRLFYGNQTAVRITFNNIRTLDQLAQTVSKYTLESSDKFLAFFKKQAQTSNGANYISRFIPNSYDVYWTITPEEFAQKMVDNYNEFWDSGSRMSDAEGLGFSKEQIVTIASIVIEETKNEGEMSDIAGVYINRLRKGMPLQADPTVKFAIGDFAIKRILNRHLNYDSPYNTYKNSGLPPGPICSPAIVAIDAVLNYSNKPHNYLYFCANADFSGTHAFAATLSEHNNNAKAYHKELNRRKIK